MASNLPSIVSEAVLVKGDTSVSAPAIRGYDWSAGVDYEKILDSYLTTGFQAQNYGKAVLEIRRMLAWSLADEPVAEDEDDAFLAADQRKNVRCKIFLAYTSNLISAGLRETIRFLVEKSHVQVLVASAGGIEEDLIKCLAQTFEGSFELDGVALRKKGLNRIGNMLVPNNNYCLFEDWITPILDKMHDEQEQQAVSWTPSSMVHRLGKEINDKTSVCYWA